MAEQNVERERVFIQVPIKHELPVDVASLLRLENGRVSLFVQNCQEQTIMYASATKIRW